LLIRPFAVLVYDLLPATPNVLDAQIYLSVRTSGGEVRRSIAVSVAQTIARYLPPALRGRGRDWFETQFRGMPPAMLKYRAFQLSLDLDMVLSHYRVEHPNVRYLEVGAFDGIVGDPIYPLIERHALQGILIEPQRDAFERLKTNYARFPNFRFANAAIADHDGSLNLFRIRPGASGPEWLHGIASFDRNVLMSRAHLAPNLESMIETEQVRCLTFETLFKEFDIEHVDFLQVDAEGFDAEILRLFDIPARKPAIVRFEHCHLSIADHAKSIGLLVTQGYRVQTTGSDTLAYRSIAKL
jgi:FkbM family methyltransferase